MRRLLLPLFFLVGVSWTAGAQPDPTMPQPTPSEGDAWSYTTTLSPPDASPVAATATTSFVRADELTIGGNTTPAYVYRTSHEGSRQGETVETWYRTSDFAKVRVVQGSPAGESTYELAEACAEWRFPMRVGDAYTSSCLFEGDDGSFTIDSSWTVRRAERVTVPAGTFDALVLEQEESGSLLRWWFAPEACWFVKHESLDAQGEPLESMELTSFTCASAQAPTPTPSPTSASPTPTPTPSPGQFPPTTTPSPTLPQSSPTATPTAPAGATPSPEEEAPAPLPAALAVAALAGAAALVLRRKDS